MNLKNSLAVVVVLIIVYLGVSNSTTKDNNRRFNFSYSVNFEPTDGKKFEAWIPYPQSNEVQNISNISINTDLKYEILSESKTELYDESFAKLLSSCVSYLWSYNSKPSEPLSPQLVIRYLSVLIE